MQISSPLYRLADVHSIANPPPEIVPTTLEFNIEVDPTPRPDAIYRPGPGVGKKIRNVEVNYDQWRHVGLFD